MNETSQIQAMKAELVAQGYLVSQDIGMHEIMARAEDRVRHANLTLDLVATMQPGAPRSGPSTLIIEIANRARPGTGAGGAGLGVPDDEAAVGRFDAISAFVRTRDDLDFQIRFLDVSRERARARGTRAKAPGDREAIARELGEATRRLAEVADAPGDLKALMVARLWAKWARAAGQMHAGRSDRSMRTADLRTIQKELYDHQVVAMPPTEYNAVQRDLMAINEGGDFSAANVLRLEGEVRSLLAWVSARHGIDLGDRMDADPAPEAPRPGI